MADVREPLTVSLKEVFLVMASSGEYSARDDWPERAFADEDAAQAFCDGISAAARAYAVASRDHYERTCRARRMVGCQDFPPWPLSAEEEALRAKADEMVGPPPTFEYEGATRAGDLYSVERVAFGPNQGVRRDV